MIKGILFFKNKHNIACAAPWLLALSVFIWQSNQVAMPKDVLWAGDRSGRFIPVIQFWRYHAGTKHRKMRLSLDSRMYKERLFRMGLKGEPHQLSSFAKNLSLAYWRPVKERQGFRYKLILSLSPTKKRNYQQFLATRFGFLDLKCYRLNFNAQTQTLSPHILLHEHYTL